MDNNKDEKILLTLKEAANYFGIGINTLRRLTNKHTNLCIFNGNRRMIKRSTMEKWLLNHNVFDC
ncbi:helix-turn-helix domain-containing protein [Faecalibacillus intestinalis]|uniref:helix-turn-helix domain-containing protein n=1 Tax=Faecalibacillus intestinalis TaxID=1982626 RepID=UPI0032C0590E